MDDVDWAILRNRAIGVGAILVVVLCLLYSTFASFVSNTTVNEMGQRVANEHKGDFFEAGEIGIVAVLLIVVLFFVVKSFGGYKAHRRHEHAFAGIVPGPHNQIAVFNLDDVDVAELGHNWNYSNNIGRTNLGDGTWVYTFQDEADEEEMRMTEANLNSFLDQVINPAKDRS